MDDLVDILASNEETFARFRRWAMGDHVVLGELVTSITEWGLKHRVQIETLTGDEVRRLARMFGYALDELMIQAEANERLLLADLLQDIELEEAT